MVEILKGRIPEREGLREVLEIVTTSKDVNIGILYISGGEVSGRIGVAWGRYLTGAILDSGETGRVALRKLLLLRAGTFRFIDTNGEPDMELRQSLGVDLNALVPYVPNEIRPTVTPFLFETAEIEDFQRLKSPAQTGEVSTPKASQPLKATEAVRTSMADLASAITDITEDNTQLLNSVDFQSGLTLGDELRTAYQKAVNTDPSGYQEMSLPNNEELTPSSPAVQPMIDLTQPSQGNQVVDIAASVVRRIDSELGTNFTTGIVRPSAESLEPTMEIVKPKAFERPTLGERPDASNEETQPLTQAQVTAAIENSRVRPTAAPEPGAEPERPAPMSSLKKPFTRLIGAARNRSRLNAEAKLANTARAADNEASETTTSVTPPDETALSELLQSSVSEPVHESVSTPDAVSEFEDSSLTAEDSEPVLFTAVESKADILRQARKEAATFLAQETRAATHLRLKPVSKILEERAAKHSDIGNDSPVRGTAAEDFHTSFDSSPTLETDNTPSKPTPFNVSLPPPPVPSWLGATETATGDTPSSNEPGLPRAPEEPVSQMDLQERLELDTLQAVRAIEIMQEQGTEQLNPFPELEAQEQRQWAEPSLNSLFEPSTDNESEYSSGTSDPSRPFDISNAVTEAMRSFKVPELPKLPNLNTAEGNAAEVEWGSRVEKDEGVVDRESENQDIEPLFQSTEPHVNMADLRGKRPVPPVPTHPFLSTINNRQGEGRESELAVGFPPIAPHFELPELIAVPGADQLEPPGNIPPAPMSGDRGRRLSEQTLAAPAQSSMLRTAVFCLVLFVLSCVATVLLAPGLLQWVTSLLHR